MIIDLVRSDTPGHTGHHEMADVCSSRAKRAQLVLFNSSVFDRIESKSSPYVQSLVSWVQSHTKKGMVIETNAETAKEWRVSCYKCYRFGHKGDACIYTTTKATIICPLAGCHKNHHPRDCYKKKKAQAPVEPADKSEAPAKSTHKAEKSVESVDKAPYRPTRSEQAKKNLEASRGMKKLARKLAKGEDIDEEA